jgi:thiamine biosynthesis lipoprotein
MGPGARRFTLLLLVIPAAFALGALRQRQTDRAYHETLYVFGTLVEIVVHGEDEARARSAVAEAGRTLQQLHSDWHAWNPGMLESLNAALAEGQGHRVNDRLAQVLRQGQIYSCESGGLFQPAIGGLIELWGFHQDTPPEGAPPADAAIDALRAADPRMSDLHIDGQWISSDNPAVQLDLGGFAKGAALDLIAQGLQARGVDNAVLNAGGDVNVIGSHGARPWRVAIRDPFIWGAVAAVEMKPGEVLYTSGNYERFFEFDGQRFAHIIDPRSGSPVGNVVSVSVLDNNGARADAAATALSVAGRADWARTAAAMGVEAVLLITDTGELHVSPAMRARLEPVDGDWTGALHVVSVDPQAPDAVAQRARCTGH